jgi:prepilin-type processing-associated H-X9-DG protein
MKRRPNNGRCPAARSRCPTSCATRQSAFSLIELMIVAVLLLGLTTMYWGGNAASRQRKQQVLCQQNLQKIFVALQIYANDQGGKFPEVTNAQTSEAALDRLVPKYTVDTASFICPGSGNSSLPSGESLLKHRISYAYYMGWRSADEQMVLMTDRQVDTKAKTNGQWVFSDSGTPPGNNHKKYGGNLLFCDGHIQLSPSAAPVALPIPSGVVLLNPK